MIPPNYSCEIIPPTKLNNEQPNPNPPLLPIKMSYDQYIVLYNADSIDSRDPYRATIYANNLKKINAQNSLTSRTYDMGLN